MADYGIETVQGLVNPQLSNEWLVQFTKVPAGVDLNDVTYRVLGSQLPSSKVESYPRPFMGLEFIVPSGMTNHGTVELEFEEDDRGFVMEQMVAWRDFIKDAKTGAAGTTKIQALKGNLMIQLLDRTHAATAKAYNLLGIFPVSLGGGGLGYGPAAGNVGLSHKIQFSYDTWNLGPQGSAGSGI